MRTATAADKTFWIASKAWQAIEILAQAHYPFETGGMLIGYQADDASVVVTEIIGPGPNAKHTRMSFRPDHDYQQQRLDDLFRHSNGKTTYIGDWHTHPNGFNALSRKDMRVLRRIAETPEAQTEHPVMLVLATSALGEGNSVCCVQFQSYTTKRLFWPVYNLMPLTIRHFD
jgi:integrative and conjugative element protein (TIGR02256 family)